MDIVVLKTDYTYVGIALPLPVLLHDSPTIRCNIFSMYVYVTNKCARRFY